MNTKPLFRFKMFVTLVLVVFISLVVQERAWFHAGDLFFGTPDLGDFLVKVVGPLCWEALPLIVVFGALLFRRLRFLESAVLRLHEGQPLSPDEQTRAKKDLLAIPAWVFAVNFTGYGLGIVVEAVVNPQSILSLVGLLEIIFDLVAGGLFAFFLLGLFEMFLAVPRSLLHVTKVDESIGKKHPRHRTTTIFVVLLSSWLVLFALTLGVKFSSVQMDYTSALQRVINGEDKAAVAKDFFDRQRLTFPHAGKAQNDDLMAIKPDLNLIGFYYVPPFFLLLGLGTFMWWIGSRHQARQLGALRDRLNEALAGGDLGKKIEIVQFDEVGELSSAVNALTAAQAYRLERLTAAATAVDTAFGPLSEAAEEVNIASAAILESTAEIAEKARNEIGSVGEAEASLDKALGAFEAVSRSVEAQAGFVAEASSAMTEMASSITSVTKTTDEARALTLRLKESSQAGTQSLGASVEAIRAIEAASREVNALTSAIAKISAQTNLLAMNAAIEAAHAGDKGAGFAVVAEEVRNLALSSSESNKKIKQKTAVMLNLVENGVKLTSEVGEAFGRINSDVAATASLVSEINSAMQEQNTGTDQILRSTASLVDTSHTIQQSAVAQKEQNTRLREAVARITASFQTIHAGAQGAAQDGERIRQAVVRLEAVARDGQGVVDEMANLVNQRS